MVLIKSGTVKDQSPDQSQTKNRRAYVFLTFDTMMILELGRKRLQSSRLLLNWQRFCEVVIELYYQEVWLVLDNIYMRICLAHNHVTDQGLPIQHLLNYPSPTFLKNLHGAVAIARTISTKGPMCLTTTLGYKYC